MRAPLAPPVLGAVRVRAPGRPGWEAGTWVRPHEPEEVLGFGDMARADRCFAPYCMPWPEAVRWCGEIDSWYNGGGKLFEVVRYEPRERP